MSKAVEKWTLEEVLVWLERIGLGQYSEIFKFNGINGRILATMTEDDVRRPPFAMSKFCDIRLFSIELKEALENSENEVMEEQCFADIAGNDLENNSRSTLNMSPVVTEPDIGSSQTRTEKNLTSTNDVEKEEIPCAINVQSLEKLMLSEELEAKAAKYDRGEYASDMEAFFDGVPGFDCIEEDEEEIKPKTVRLKQIKYQARLKAEGKSPPKIEEKKWDDLFYKDSDGNEYVKVFPKQGKPPKGLNRVYFSSVVSANEIYVYIEEQRNFLKYLSTEMQRFHSEQSYPLQERFIKIGYACAAPDVDGLWCRGRIISMPFGDSIDVFLVDYNKKITIRLHSLKALRSDTVLKYEVQIFKGKVCNICVETKDELKLLRDLLLDENNSFCCYFNTRAKEPWQMNIQIVDGSQIRSFSDFYKEKLQLLFPKPKNVVADADISCSKKEKKLNGNVSQSNGECSSLQIESSDSKRLLESVSEVLKNELSAEGTDHRATVSEIKNQTVGSAVVDNVSISETSVGELKEESDAQATSIPERGPCSLSETTQIQKEITTAEPIEQDKPVASFLKSDPVPKLDIVMAKENALKNFALKKEHRFGFEIPKYQRKYKTSEMEIVCVSHVDSPNEFYLMNEENRAKVLKDRKSMARFYEKKRSLRFDWETVKPGTACAAQFDQDNQWYRGEILAITTDGAEVRFVDFGNVDIVDYERIRPLLQKFCYPAVCSFCCLEDFAISESATDEELAELAIKFEDFVTPWVKLWLMKFGQMPEDDEIALPVSFFDRTSNVCVQNELIEFLSSE